MRQGRRDGALPDSIVAKSQSNAYAIVSQRVVQVTTLRGCQQSASSTIPPLYAGGLPPFLSSHTREIHVHHIVSRHALHRRAHLTREIRAISDLESGRCSHNVCTCMFVFIFPSSHVRATIFCFSNSAPVFKTKRFGNNIHNITYINFEERSAKCCAVYLS